MNQDTIQKAKEIVYDADNRGVGSEHISIISELLTDHDDMRAQLKAAEERVGALEAWYNDGWLKGSPEINATVLIKHELGVGHNYDVACYQGKDAAGDDKFMSSCGTVIFKQDVLQYRVI